MTTVAVIPVQDSNPASPADAELLGRFVNDHDAQAFATLVNRHRAMVLGVCTRVLRDSHDIEDVFQGTFLVLVRDAGRVRMQQSIASWLYGVAFRLALRVVRQKQRRRETRLLEGVLPEASVFQDLAARYDQQLLDEELTELPDRYRQVMVLRYLAEKTPREIAAELNMTVGAVDGVIKRGKSELRARLKRRGVDLSVTLVGVQICQQAAQAAPAEQLIESAVQTGLAWQQGSDLSHLDLPPDLGLELAGKELITMPMLTKAGYAVGTVLGALALGLGIATIGGNIAGRATAQPPNGTQNLLAAVGDVDPPLAESNVVAQVTDRPKPAKPDQPAAPNPNQAPRDPNAPEAAGQRRRWDVKPRSPNVAKIESALEGKTEVAFDDNLLEEALNYLEDLHHIEIRLNHNQLGEQVNADTKVSLAITGVSLKSALRMMLEPLELDYVIKNEVLMVTPVSEARKFHDTRVYDVSRLKGISTVELEEIIYATVAPGTWDLRTSSPQVTAVPDMGSVAGKRLPTPGPEPKGPPTAADNTTPPQAQVAPSVGEDSAERGQIRNTKRTLIIRQTQRIHDEIVELLDQLEETSDANDPTPKK